MTDQEKLFLQRLEMRVDRLKKLIALNGPKFVIASEVVLVLRAMHGFAPKEMAHAEAEWHEEAERRAAGLCIGCGRGHGFEVNDLCVACTAGELYNDVLGGEAKSEN